MPINIPYNLPARKILEQENVFIMSETRAKTQDIRPLNILVLNLMPNKEKTETQLLRLLSNTPLQVHVDFIHTKTYESKNVTKSHLEKFYLTFENIKENYYDGMIITGAPVEHLTFTDVSYWDEITDIMAWSNSNVTSILHICWAAQAALYYHYGINKEKRPNKLSGIYRHNRIETSHKLMRGINDTFVAPHSRHTDAIFLDIKNNENLIVLDTSDEAGPLLIASADEKHVFITGHIEYDDETLWLEYLRDLERGLSPNKPEHYFASDGKRTENRWRSLSYLVFSNWLNYFVYQETPYLFQQNKS